MTLAELKSFIKKETWWSEEAPAVPQFFWLFCHAHMEQKHYTHLPLPRTAYFIFKDDFVYEETLAQDKLSIFHALYEEYRTDPSNIEKLYRVWKGSVENVTRIGDVFVKQSSDHSNEKLWKTYDRMIQGILDYWRIGWIWECTDVFSEQELLPLVQRYLPSLREEERQEYIRVMAAPESLSYMEEARRDFLTLLFRDDHSPNAFAPYAERYSWIGNNYKEGRTLTAEHYAKEGARELERSSRHDLEREFESLHTKVRRLKEAKEGYLPILPPELLTMFQFLSTIARYIDERKAFAQRMCSHLEQMAIECAKRFTIPISDVKYYFYDELRDLCLHGVRLDEKVLVRRKQGCTYVTWRDEHGKVCREWWGEWETQTLYKLTMAMQKTDSVKGQVACAPVPECIGTVQVVLDIGKTEFQDGNILVTTMTRPEFLPIMRRARAVITDEGGIGCHAAVISRELRIPCIIGTKNATKLLKTGDTVTINLTTGEVSKV